MRDASRWRPARAFAPTVEVTAAEMTPAEGTSAESGLDVGSTAFASPTAGWALVGAPLAFRLLYTEDAGATWTPQLAWQTGLTGRLTAFDARGAALAIGVTPEIDTVNGRRVGTGDHGLLFAATEDAGATWSVASPPRPNKLTGMFHFLTARRLWAITWVPESGRKQLVRTEDAGATWAVTDCPGEDPVTLVAFSSPVDGILVAVDQFRSDILWTSNDGGDRWTRTLLPPPAGVPANAETWLTPVVHAGAPALLLLKAGPRRPRHVRWAGHYAYIREHGEHAWSGPYRLPTSTMGADLPVTLAWRDDRFRMASGHDIWSADAIDGPWQHQPVPLPDTQMLGASWDPRLAPVPTETIIADMAPVGHGVIWLTTTHGRALGGLPTGQLYRSDDDGTTWTRVAVRPD